MLNQAKALLRSDLRFLNTNSNSLLALYNTGWECGEWGGGWECGESGLKCEESGWEYGE